MEGTQELRSWLDEYMNEQTLTKISEYMITTKYSTMFKQRMQMTPLL